MRFIPLYFICLLTQISTPYASVDQGVQDQSQSREDKNSEEVFLSRLGINAEGKKLSWIKRKVFLTQKNSKKEILAMKAVDEFSGALDHAHRRGIRGKDFTVLILDSSGLAGTIYQRLGRHFKELHTDRSSKTREEAKEKVDLGTVFHGTNTTFAFHQIAPQAEAIVRPASLFLRPEEQEKYTQAMKEKKLVAVNMSLGNTPGNSEKNLIISTALEFFIAHPNCPLFVKSAENNGAYATKEKNPMIFHIAESEKIMEHTIFVGALSPDSSFALDYSSSPGKNKELQKNWICTLGTITGFNNSDSKIFTKKDFIKREGTSFAAPIVTGAAVLISDYIKQKYGIVPPSKTIKEILLYSANRNFFSQNFYNPHAAYYIYDPQDPANKRFLNKEEWKKFRSEYSEQQSKKGSLRTSYPLDGREFQEHDTQFYGMGILDIKNAFVYADIKYEHPDWQPEAIRKEMLERNYEESQRSATAIQKWWRSKRTLKAEKLKE